MNSNTVTHNRREAYCYVQPKVSGARGSALSRASVVSAPVGSLDFPQQHVATPTRRPASPLQALAQPRALHAETRGAVSVPPDQNAAAEAHYGDDIFSLYLSDDSSTHTSDKAREAASAGDVAAPAPSGNPTRRGADKANASRWSVGSSVLGNRESHWSDSEDGASSKGIKSLIRSASTKIGIKRMTAKFKRNV